MKKTRDLGDTFLHSKNSDDGLSDSDSNEISFGSSDSSFSSSMNSDKGKDEAAALLPAVKTKETRQNVSLSAEKKI
jgi:hypothetical protein